MTRLLLLAAATLALVLSACASGRETPDIAAAVKASGKLRVGVKADTPPFGMVQGGTYIGFDVEIAMAVAQRLGVEAVFVPVTSANRNQVLLDGQVDCVVASQTITRSRDRLVDFSIPYFQDGQALLVKADSGITSYRDLAGKAVGAVKGSTSASNMRVAQPDCTVVEYPSFAELVPALERGTVAAVTSDSIILLGLQRQSRDRKALSLLPERFSTEPYGIAVQPNQSSLRDAINVALQEMWEDGTWQHIFDAWFGPGGSYHSDGLKFTITPFPK